MSKDNIGLSMKYFVLNPHKKSIYGIASRKALEIYAETIRDSNFNLYRDLMEWVKKIRLEIQEETERHPNIENYGMETGSKYPPNPSEIPSIRREVEVETRYIK